MSKQLSVGNLGSGATGNARLKLLESPDTLEATRVLKGWDPLQSRDARPQSEGTIPMLPGEMRQPVNRDVTPDLCSHCPVCGKPYQAGEPVLALACLSFAPSAVPCSPATANGDPSSKIILGHHECVLPRLLTLLAGFQPELRFVRASNDFSAGESVFSERRHDDP
jgi:hypothetical protein